MSLKSHQKMLEMKMCFFVLWQITVGFFWVMMAKQITRRLDHIPRLPHLSILPFPSINSATKLWIFSQLPTSANLRDNHSIIITPILSQLVSAYMCLSVVV